ncbi:MAG: hypothetical protein M3401_06680 [Actinomycetota bacterium]|nr:hypothetical protein [Actinomycetota bacterium]
MIPIVAALSPATAALIGAATASVVALVAQYLAHHLSIKRDRRNQKRARLHDVVVTASIALFSMSGDKPSRDYSDPHPESIAALSPEYQDPDFMALQERMTDALALLLIHFGDDHWLIDEYMAAMEASTAARLAMIDTLALKDDEAGREKVRDHAKALRAGQIARLNWSAKARDHVDKL